MLTPLITGEVKTCFGVWVSADSGRLGQTDSCAEQNQTRAWRP